MGETNYCALKWEQRDKTQLQAELLQTLNDLVVLLEAGPSTRCQACRQHGPEADCTYLNLINKKWLR